MAEKPYPGLRPFRDDESDIFFGREDHVVQMIRKLNRTGFLAIVGPSGCGKSSLVNAGLIDGLELGLMTRAGARWRIAKFRPGNQPYRRLTKALLSERGIGRERSGHHYPEQEEGFLMAALKRGPLGITEVLRETPLPDNTNLLIVVDQFEEIFRYRKHGGMDEADGFVALLLRTVEERVSGGFSVCVVITMRSDFIGDCAIFPGLAEAVNESQFLTPRLTRDQAAEAVEGPARVFNGSVEPGLTNRILNEMGADPDQLPVMQHLMMRIWSEKESQGGDMVLTLTDYDNAGGFKNALSKHANHAFDELDEASQKIGETLFRCLSERSPELRDTRRPVELKHVADVADLSLDKLVTIVDNFRGQERSFITPSLNDLKTLEPHTVIDISHESLIRQWDKMKKWVEEEGASGAMFRRLEESVMLHKKGEAALLINPELDNAINWRKKENLNEAWAARYSKFSEVINFKDVIDFIDKSRIKEVERKKKDERERLEKLRKTRRLLAYAVVALIIAIGLVLWGFYERGRVKHGLVMVKQAFEKVEETEQVRTETLFESLLTHASLLSENEDYMAAKKVLNESKSLDKDVNPDRVNTRNLLEWYTNLMSGAPVKVYKGAGAQLFDVAVSPDRKYVAGVGERDTVVLFDLKTGEIISRLKGHTDVVSNVVFHPENKWLGTIGVQDSQIILWKIPDGEIIRKIKIPEQGTSIAVSNDGKLLGSGGFDNNVSIWDAETGELLKTLEGHKGIVSGIDFSPRAGNASDLQLIGTSSYDHSAIIWDLERGKPRHRLKGHTDKVLGVAFSPNGKTIATSSKDKTIRLWDVQTGKLLRILQGHRNAVFGMRFIDSGKRLVSASFDSTLRVWDVETGVTLRVLQGHEGGVAFIDGDEDDLFSASKDGTIMGWKSHSLAGHDGFRMYEMEEKPNSSIIGPNGNLLSVGFSNGAVRVYDLKDMTMLWESRVAHSYKVNRLSFNHDATLLASCGMDNKINIFEINNGELLKTFNDHEEPVYDIQFSPSGTQLVSASYDGKIGIFNVETGKGRLYQAHDGRGYSVSFNRKGNLIISTGEDGKAIIWDIEKGSPVPIKEFSPSKEESFWGDFSPDSSTIATCGRDLGLQIFDLEKGEKIHSLTGHENTIYRLAFSPDGKQIGTVSSDATVRFWVTSQ